MTREEVVRFYVKYDWRKKKSELPLPNMEDWPWNDAAGIDQKLHDSGLKTGVLAAYLTWRLVEFSVADLLECAIVNHIFPREPQALSRLVLLGRLSEWFPNKNPEWWRLIGNGSDINALIVRPALQCEGPAKWYIEDGSGRALALLQRMLRYGEVGRTVPAYLGHEPDEHSAFINSRPELKST